jgi:hypothetical protein
MVALLVYPLLAVAGLFALDAVLPADLLAVMSGSFAFTAVLSVIILGAVLAAAWRNRDNTVLMSAWLFLFCGLSILSFASLIDPFFPGNEAWTEELFSTASFFPLLFFAVYIASPMRLIMISQRRRALYVIAGVIALAAVFAVVFLPWLLLYEGPRLHASTKHLLRLVKPVLDTVLAEPLALVVLAVGFSSGSRPYLLTGIGLVLLIPEDILDHFQLLQQLDPYGQAATLVQLASRLYLLNGALLAAARRRNTAVV